MQDICFLRAYPSRFSELIWAAVHGTIDCHVEYQWKSVSESAGHLGLDMLQCAAKRKDYLVADRLTDEEQRRGFTEHDERRKTLPCLCKYAAYYFRLFRKLKLGLEALP